MTAKEAAAIMYPETRRLDPRDEEIKALQSQVFSLLQTVVELQGAVTELSLRFKEIEK